MPRSRTSGSRAWPPISGPITACRIPTFLAYAAVFLETVGVICVAIGLFTRFFAAALAIELLIALFAAHWVKGFSVSAGGYEYVLFLGIVMFAIALHAAAPIPSIA